MILALYSDYIICERGRIILKNLKSNTIVLGTSLAPRNIEKQVEEVLSWVEKWILYNCI